MKGGDVRDIARDYFIVDETTGETMATLDENVPLLKHVRQVRDPDDVELPRIGS